MGIIYTDESAYIKELAKWEQHRGKITEAPGNPYVFRPFPKCLYRAVKLETGKVVSYETDLRTGQPYPGTMRIVGSDDEMLKAKGEGWIEGSPADAVAAFEQREQEIGRAAAEAIAAAQRMSERARKEFDAAQAVDMEHVTDVTPATKKRDKEQRHA